MTGEAHALDTLAEGSIYGCSVALLVKMLLVTSCIIPSSGMENSLYQGEGILVNKWSYGLRVPFPSLWGYHRLGKKPVEKGDIFLFNNPDPRRESEWMERRELFISRCTGVAGDTLMLNRELTEIGGEVLSPDSKELYAYPSAAEDLVWEALQSIGIAEENKLVSYLSDGSYIRSFSHYEYYLMVQKLGGKVVLTPLTSKQPQEVYPFVVPRKGMPVKVYPWNVALLCNTIRAHEHRQAEVCRDTLWVEGCRCRNMLLPKIIIG